MAEARTLPAAACPQSNLRAVPARRLAAPEPVLHGPAGVWAYPSAWLCAVDACALTDAANHGRTIAPRLPAATHCCHINPGDAPANPAPERESVSAATRVVPRPLASPASVPVTSVLRLPRVCDVTDVM